MSNSPRGVQTLDSARKTLYGGQSPPLRQPAEARKEIALLHEQLREYKQFKTQHMFLGKRDRLMRTGWRHGILGIDDSDSKTTQCFYRDAKDAKMNAQKSRDQINQNRTQCKFKTIV